MLAEILTISILAFLHPTQEPHTVGDQAHSAAQASRKANRLAGETSPYLLQHAYNPVDWYPWGEEALARAKAENRPIFLSIGYSSCHWCHVMERESFESEDVAAYLNEHFVSIKVDREERPDLDEIYMSAVQRLNNGGGGWPMTVLLTPELQPFFGGTYFPPHSAHGRPGFMEVLQHFVNLWKTREKDVRDYAGRVNEALAVELPSAPPSKLPSKSELQKLESDWLREFTAVYDSEYGGFGRAPKFPRAEDLRWLLAAADRSDLNEAREMAVFTLRKMAEGGLYDQIAGGFARYSVDERWAVPHFEKMLYDQGTLIPAYLEAWRQTGDPFFKRIVVETCDYLLREMRDDGGAFWSATDADSEGEEGKFFVWNPVQLEQVLGEKRAAFAAALYGVSSQGNFEHGQTVLFHAASAIEAAARVGLELDAVGAEALAEEVRGELYAARLERIPPLTDDKIILAWNGLLIDAFAQAGRILDEPRYTQAAIEAADFLLENMRSEAGWMRTWRGGKAQNAAVLEDFAYFSGGLLSLFQSTGAERWLHTAEEVAEHMLDHYWDDRSAVFFNTDGRDETVLHRMQAPWDGATPAPNAVALESLVLLHAFTTEPRWLAYAEKGFASLLPMIRNSPRGFTASMRPLFWAAEEPRVAVVVGSGTRASLAGWRQSLFATGRPPLITVFREQAAPDSKLGLFAHRGAQAEGATLYLCRGSSCLAPSHDPGQLPELLAQ